MMKRLTKLVTLATIVFILCIPAVSAFSVQGMSISPSGALTPGNPVTISFTVGFAASGGNNFDAGSDLVLTTDLTNPKWTYTLILDGVENARNPVSGKTLDLSGFELEYPSSVDESVKVSLEGTAPSVDRTTNKVILNVHEVNSNGDTITSSMVNKTALVINVADITSQISEKSTNLQALQSAIDEKSALGIDTSAAQQNYDDANTQIAAAQALPATQYETAIADLTAAQKSIDDGGTALDMAWAENEVANAEVPINNVDSVIAWFKGNKSTADDTQLVSIVAKREVAVEYISNARDYITNGKYDEARSKAADAFSKGNESYTDALARQKVLLSGWQLPIPNIKLPGGIFLIVGIIVVVLVVVGVIIYRKRSRWDELG
jgi:hypothetical protein